MSITPKNDQIIKGLQVENALLKSMLESKSKQMLMSEEDLKMYRRSYPDKLDQIFEAQAKFRKLMGKGQDCITDLMNEQQKGQLIYDHCQAIASELQELINCTYWKSWAKEAKEGKRYMFRNKENLKEEIADILCFLGDICAAVDMDASELAAINVRKTEVNIQRQLTKYAMDTKDGKDSEAVWKQIADGELKSLKPAQDKIEESKLDTVQSNPSVLISAGKPKYFSEQPDKVTIYSHAVNPTGIQIYSVTLESTNETKEIEVSQSEIEATNTPRNLLMQKVAKAFNLTKPFEIVEL